MCDSCNAGFGAKAPNAIVKDTSCLACGANCNPLDDCDARGSGKCDSCKAGYALTDTFSCLPCNTGKVGCSECSIAGTSNTITCSNCDAGYYFTGSECVSCTVA